ncbi:Integrase catalytic subunit [Escherichia coli D6-113.11]|nr:Integrase catalytic subunit [Escherichia coli D6-113.11]CDU36223.1 Integrase catalytic subunit [Escherichia coli D6-113.11]
MPTFIEAYNNRFATSPRTTDNAHLDVHHSEEELGYIFSLQAKRVLSKNLTFQYKSSAFQVRSEGRGYRLRHSVVTVCENFDGEINVLYDGKALGWEKYVDGPEPIPLDDEKSVHERVDNARIDLRSKYYVKPKADHPWLTRRTQSHQQVKPPKLPKKKPDPDKKD